MAQRIPQVHQRPGFEQCIHALRAAIDRGDVERRPSRRRVDPVHDPTHDNVLFFSAARRRIRGQTIREPSGIVRRRRQVDEPRKQRTLHRGHLRRGPRPRRARVRRLGPVLVLILVLGGVGVGNDDGGWHRLVVVMVVATRGGRTQPNDARKRCADRLEVRVDRRGRGRGAGSPRELAAQWCAYEGAHLLDGEFWFGEEVAEFREGTLSNKKKKGHAFTFVCREEKGKGGGGL